MTNQVTLRFRWSGEMDELNQLVKPLADAAEAQGHVEPEMDIESIVKITDNYPSIEAARDILEPWVKAWSGDEWGESMWALHSAGHTDYGLDDEDCARVTRILVKNILEQKDWMDTEGHSYGLNTPEDQAQAAKEAREARDYWLKSGNLGNWANTIEKAKATIDTLPKWLFGEEND